MDLLLRPGAPVPTRYHVALVAIPVVVDLLLRLEKLDAMEWSTSRNPCCSGPTASTKRGYFNEVLLNVAIPVVVDLLLRPAGGDCCSSPKEGRNPCCSGPTASTSVEHLS